MGYLFLQTLIWLLLAFLLGLILGWLLRGILCRDGTGSGTSTGMADDDGMSHTSSASARMSGSSSSPSMASSAGAADTAASVDISDDMRPTMLAGPNGMADDLKRIKGVGPVIQTTLNELGVYHFQQIADFTPDNVAWVDNHISFPGRINREGWVAQADDLVKGVKTEFSERYDKGEVGDKNPNHTG